MNRAASMETQRCCTKSKLLPYLCFDEVYLCQNKWEM